MTSHNGLRVFLLTTDDGQYIHTIAYFLLILCFLKKRVWYIFYVHILCKIILFKFMLMHVINKLDEVYYYYSSKENDFNT